MSDEYIYTLGSIPDGHRFADDIINAVSGMKTFPFENKFHLNMSIMLYVSIRLENCLTQNSDRANDDLVWWRIYASHGLDNREYHAMCSSFPQDMASTALIEPFFGSWLAISYCYITHSDQIYPVFDARIFPRHDVACGWTKLYNTTTVLRYHPSLNLTMHQSLVCTLAPCQVRYVPHPIKRFIKLSYGAYHALM